MDQKNYRIIGKLCVIGVLMAILPAIVFARGNNEPYGEILDKEFHGLLVSLEGGKTDADEAIRQLHELRVEYGRENSAEYREMERLLIAVQAGEMTAVQARERLHAMDESKTEMTQEQLRERDRIQTQEQDPDAVEQQSQNQNGESGNQSGSGSPKD